MSEKSLTLWELEDTLVALLDSAEMVEADEALYTEALKDIAAVGEKAIAKRDNVVRMLRYLEAQSVAARVEADRCEQLALHYERCRGRLEDYVLKVIERFAPEAKELAGSIGALKLRQNPPHIEITDETVVPGTYKTVTVTVSLETWLKMQSFFPHGIEELRKPGSFKVSILKKSVADRIKDGEIVPGAALVFGDRRLEVK